MKVLPTSKPIRRICADFHDDQATEIDMLEVRIGIHRAARSKSDRDKVLTDTALTALKHVVEAYSSLIGDKYPDYQTILGFLESGTFERYVCEPPSMRIPGKSAETSLISDQSANGGDHEESDHSG